MPYNSICAHLEQLVISAPGFYHTSGIVCYIMDRSLDIGRGATKLQYGGGGASQV